MNKFREWLEERVVKNDVDFMTWRKCLTKYDELAEQPEFKVGDKVSVDGEEVEISEVITEPTYRMKNRLKTVIFSAEELTLAPKTKLVFSLEKWVEKRIKERGSLYIIANIDDAKRLVGKTMDEINSPGKVYICTAEPDLFVEVDA